MKIPKQDVWYCVAWHNEEEGIPFYLDGRHYRSQRQALREAQKVQRYGQHKTFVAEIIVRRAKMTPAKPSKRKAA